MSLNRLNIFPVEEVVVPDGKYWVIVQVSGEHTLTINLIETIEYVKGDQVFLTEGDILTVPTASRIHYFEFDNN